MRRLYFMLALLGTAALVASCYKGVTGNETPVAYAHLRLAHLAPGVTFADPWLDQTMIQDSVPYKSFSSRFDIVEGSHQIGWSVTGIQPPNFVVERTIPFAADSFYTVALTGGMAFNLLVVTDRMDRDTSHALVRFANAFAGTPQLVADFNRQSPHGSEDSLNYLAAGPYHAVLPGVLDLRAYKTDGTLTVDSMVTVGPDSNYTVYLTGGLGDAVPPHDLAFKIKSDAP
jgi:hypothetical protein